MKARASRAIWLLVLSALVVSEVRSRTHQLPAGPAPAASDEVTLRVIVVDSADKAQRIVVRLRAGRTSSRWPRLSRSIRLDPPAGSWAGWLSQRCRLC